MKKHTREDDLFIKKVKEVLDDDVESLDGAIRSRLNQARNKALAGLPDSEPRQSWPSRFRLPAFAAASIAVMFFAVVIFIGKPNQELAVKSVDDADVLFSDEDPDFYAELDFYVWLTEQDENAG